MKTPIPPRNDEAFMWLFRISRCQRSRHDSIHSPPIFTGTALLGGERTIPNVIGAGIIVVPAGWGRLPKFRLSPTQARPDDEVHHAR